MKHALFFLAIVTLCVNIAWGAEKNEKTPAKPQTATLPDKSSFSSQNLNGWKNKGYVHGQADTDVKAKLLKTMTYEIVKDDKDPQNNVVLLKTSTEADKLKDDKGFPTISNRFFKVFEIGKNVDKCVVKFKAKADLLTFASNFTS